MKDYNVMIDRQKFFDKPVRNDQKNYDSKAFKKITTGEWDHYTTGFLIDYVYFKSCYTGIAIDLSKQRAPAADSKAIRQINFMGHSGQSGQTVMLFIVEEAK